MNFNQLLELATDQKASDVYLTACEPPWFRIDGSLKKIDTCPFIHDELSTILNNCMDPRAQQIFKEKSEVDFIYILTNSSRFRVNVFKQNQGISAVFRIIPANIPTFAELELPKIINDLITLPHGLILVTGPTGSGKSTTLAAMINLINSSKHQHIITLEDPIEFVYKNDKCLISQREIGTHSQNFQSALRAALREAPDIILVGEMRDLETIRLTLTAAETGHLVFATLHTASAIKSITRIIDVFPHDEKNLIRTMLAESLQAVISQILIRRIEIGRVAAKEVMISTKAIRNLIRENKLTQIYSLMQTGATNGMYTFAQNLRSLLDRGIISQLGANEIALNKNLFD